MALYTIVTTENCCTTEEEQKVTATGRMRHVTFQDVVGWIDTASGMYNKNTHAAQHGLQ